MQKVCLVEGRYTSLKENDACDVFFDIVGVLMKGFEYEMGKRYKIDYLASAWNKSLVVTTGLKAVFETKMVKCEKILCEPFYDKEKIMREYNINADEWAAVLESDSKLNMKEPMKRVYIFQMQLTRLEDNDQSKELFETGLELLKNIC